MSRRLIVNADDFGRTRGTSAGIIRAHLNGIVTGTTAMMNLPGGNAILPFLPCSFQSTENVLPINKPLILYLLLEFQPGSE